MKICFIAPKAYQLFNPQVKTTFGGAEVQLSLLARELAKHKKLDIHFMVADYGQREVEKISDVTVWKALDFKVNIVFQVMSFFRVFNRIKADIYVQRTLTPQSGLIALYCRLAKKKFVYMVASDRESDQTHKLYKRYYGRIAAFLNFSLASSIIVQNNYQADVLSEKHSSDKVYILKKGLKINTIDDKAADKAKDYDAIWVGRCEESKNPLIFLDFAYRFPHKKFIIVAPKATDEDDYFAHVSQKSSNLLNVEFVSFASNTEIYKLLFKAKVFILTSDKEGDWPMTVLEAASCGLPIISYKLNYDYLIDKYQGGIFCNGSFEEMIRSFDELLNNEALYENMKKNAYEYVKENHDIEINARKFLNIICK